MVVTWACDSSQIFAAHASVHNCFAAEHSQVLVVTWACDSSQIFAVHASAHNCFAAEHSQVMVVTWACDSSQMFAANESAHNSFVAAERSQMKVVICACDSSQIFAVHASSHNSRSQITWVRTRRVCDEVSRVSPPVGGHQGSPAAQPRSARGICHRSRSCRGLYSRETGSSPYSLWRWAVPSLCRF